MREPQTIHRSTVSVSAADGHSLSVYVAAPSQPLGGVVVLQEIFGVNEHIRDVCDRFASEGYRAVAPHLFDRHKAGVELGGYSAEDVEEGRRLRALSTLDHALTDIAAARELAALAGKVGAIGYCWGGMLAWAAASRLKGFSACVAYYGAAIRELGEAPTVPTIAHFGERDKLIPQSEVALLRAAFPEVPVFVYPADHGFNCDRRASYEPQSAGIALARSLALLGEHVAR